MISMTYFPACHRVCLSIRYPHFNLPKQIHDLFRAILLGSAHSMLLPYQFVSFLLVQNLPGTPLSVSHGFCSVRARFRPMEQMVFNTAAG
jgi:hypothetical protein